MISFRKVALAGLAALALSGCSRREEPKREYTVNVIETLNYYLEDRDGNGSADIIRLKESDLNAWVSQEYREKGYESMLGVMDKDLQKTADKMFQANADFEFQEWVSRYKRSEINGSIHDGGK